MKQIFYNRKPFEDGMVWDLCFEIRWQLISKYKCQYHQGVIYLKDLDTDMDPEFPYIQPYPKGEEYLVYKKPMIKMSVYEYHEFVYHNDYIEIY